MNMGESLPRLHYMRLFCSRFREILLLALNKETSSCERSPFRSWEYLWSAASKKTEPLCYSCKEPNSASNWIRTVVPLAPWLQPGEILSRGLSVWPLDPQKEATTFVMICYRAVEKEYWFCAFAFFIFYLFYFGAIAHIGIVCMYWTLGLLMWISSL